MVVILQKLVIRLACMMLAVGPAFDDAVRLTVVECEETPVMPPGESDEEAPELTSERGACPVRFLRQTCHHFTVAVPAHSRARPDQCASILFVSDSPNPVLRC